MKYERIEKIRAKKIADEKLLDELVETYLISDSMAEFKLKANIEGKGKSKYMKWFSLFYFAKNHSIYEAIPWLVTIPPAVFFVIAAGTGINVLSEISKGGGWQFMCAMLFIASLLSAVAFGVFLYHLIARNLELINEKVWRHR